MAIVMDAINRFRPMMYMVMPNETVYEKIEDVPDFIQQAIPFFMVLILVEEVVQWYQGKHITRPNDSIASITSGILMQLAKVVFKSVELGSYIYVYENWRYFELPWDSAYTWWLCFLGVDFGYYWFHRAAHEVNILWAAHQVHHSSEDYNLTTATRQSVFQQTTSWIFYLPLALAIPPPIYLAHAQFNLLYQFWIHTECINSLGPLEYILNTPSHHRVHHGRNRYCIDKNYAGTLIIWDRLFGTFEAESHRVVYGLTHPINTFNPITIQICHFKYMWTTFWSNSSWAFRLSFLFKGPGWEPGKPRTGLIEDIPDVQHPVPKYHRKLPVWCDVYLLIHFIITVYCTQEFHSRIQGFSQLTVILFVAFVLLSLTTIGIILDDKPSGALLEVFRCICFLFGSQHFSASIGSSWYYAPVLNRAFELYFLVSAFVWVGVLARMVNVKWKAN